MAESIKSKYKPSYPQKYKGNPNNIICRSSWERRFCRWCDLTENVLEWGSEEFYIPYISPVDNRIHKYFPDFIVKLREATGKIKTIVVEVKPKKQTKEPKKRNSLLKKAIRIAVFLIVYPIIELIVYIILRMILICNCK